MAICKEGTYVYEKRKLYVHIIKTLLTICTYSDKVYLCQGIAEAFTVNQRIFKVFGNAFLHT